MATPIQIFCSYASKDEFLLDTLKKSLRQLHHKYSMLINDKRDIIPGTSREKKIQKPLETAHIILLLISPDFLTDYHSILEMNHALERHKRDEAQVIPIILSISLWRDVPGLGELEPLPTDGKPVTDKNSWHNQKQAFHNIVEGIGRVIKELLEKQAKSAQVDSDRQHEQETSGNAANRDSEPGGRLVKGAEDFTRSLDNTPEPARGLLQKLCDWTTSLEGERLALLYTYHGKSGAMTLLPRLKRDDAGFVSIYNNHGKAYIQFWRSVFERRAPLALAAIEGSITPIKQGNTAYEVSDDLLAMLTEAYREAVR